jgi:hypothetical protein
MDRDHVSYIFRREGNEYPMGEIRALAQKRRKDSDQFGSWESIDKGISETRNDKQNNPASSLDAFLSIAITINFQQDVLTKYSHRIALSLP